MEEITMSMLRKDPLSGGWVIIATERGKRPSDFGSVSAQTKGGFCPFCEGHETLTPPEIIAFRGSNTAPNSPGWRVRTIPNKFAALRIEGDLDRQGEGIYDKMNGIGAHEVIIETTDHMGDMSSYPLNHLSELIKMFKERSADLENDERFRYIQIFRNHGATAGASMEHPHSQLIALPIIPRWVKEELTSSLNHWESKERCLFCDIKNQEIATQKRVVYENNGFLVFEPFAAKFPFETWIIPKRHNSDFKTISDQDIHLFSEALQKALLALYKSLSDPPYNLIIHSAPIIRKNDGEKFKGIKDDFHWHVEIIPRLTKVAGFEWGTGFYINPTPPEEAAQYLREVINISK